MWSTMVIARVLTDLSMNGVIDLHRSHSVILLLRSITELLAPEFTLIIYSHLIFTNDDTKQRNDRTNCLIVSRPTGEAE